MDRASASPVRLLRRTNTVHDSVYLVSAMELKRDPISYSVGYVVGFVEI